MKLVFESEKKVLAETVVGSLETLSTVLSTHLKGPLDITVLNDVVFSTDFKVDGFVQEKELEVKGGHEFSKLLLGKHQGKNALIYVGETYSMEGESIEYLTIELFVEK